MILSRFGIYLAQAGFAGLIYAVIGATSRAFWDSKRRR